MKNLASPKINEPQGTSEFQNIPIIHGKIPPCNLGNSSEKGVIDTSKTITCKRTVMGEPSKIYSSETISGHKVATTTGGIPITDQVHIIDARETKTHGIHRCISGRLWRILDGS